MMHVLPSLPYNYAGLASVISEDIMFLHHKKHHQSYVDKLNKLLESTKYSELDTVSLLRRLEEIPEDIRRDIQNNAGGHYNHSLFWRIMSPDGGGQPSGELAEKIDEKYGSFQQFVDEFSGQALSVFGSGWTWLMPDMTILTTPNQDNPLMAGDGVPLLGLDVWEHAYYLDYKHARADYIKAWWNVVNWAEVEKRQASAIIP